MDVLLAKMDVRGSGSISFTEFCIGVQNLEPALLQGRLRKLFGVIDREKKGSISLLQLVEFFSGLGLDTEMREE